ncbi:MAG TPA: SDR family oxidoreductase [Acidimicrobiales bacterium]|nr:SDR family oxidoreductase [Acidimicrobiales bacterium]
MAERDWLVVGASGLVGADVWRRLGDLGHRATAMARCPMAGPSVQVDLADLAEVTRCIRALSPGVVVYCAGATAVDRCESDPGWARQLNVTAPEVVMEAVSEDTLMVYLSTDYVFDGTAGPYRETDTPRPVNEYGRTKLAGEAAVRSRRSHLVVRTTVVYGWESLRPPVGSLSRLAAAGAAGVPFDAPADEVGNPTFSPDLADAVVHLAAARRTGVFHVCGPDRVSRLEFSRAVLGALGHDTTLARPVHSADLRRPAVRPLGHGMVCRRASLALGRSFIGLAGGLAMAAAGRPRPAAAG